MIEAKHSPLPWSCIGTPWSEYIVRDREGRRIASCHVLEGEPDKRNATDKANMKFIVDSVNYRHSQSEMSERLYGQREDFRKKLLETTKERDKLKDLLRRAEPWVESALGYMINDERMAWPDEPSMEVYHRHVVRMQELLDEVRKALEEEVCDGK